LEKLGDRAFIITYFDSGSQNPYINSSFMQKAKKKIDLFNSIIKEWEEICTKI
jgi:hypothetical protein